MAVDTSKSDPAPDDLLASLRISETRLRGVLDSISDGFYAVDRTFFKFERFHNLNCRGRLIPGREFP